MAPLNPNAPVYFPILSPSSNITFFHASMNIQCRNNSKLKGQHKLQDDLELFHFKDNQEDDEKRTTVMIKNLPNKLMKSTLLKMLDDHCAQENKDTEENSTVSEFNFLYLPIDFESGRNLGYAFVNFTSAKAARRFYHAFHNKSWNQLHGSLKICEVTYARIQGLPALQKHFKNSVFICDNEDYLPVYFNPSRNGSCDSKQHFIGRKIMKL